MLYHLSWDNLLKCNLRTHQALVLQHNFFSPIFLRTSFNSNVFFPQHLIAWVLDPKVNKFKDKEVGLPNFSWISTRSVILLTLEMWIGPSSSLCLQNWRFVTFGASPPSMPCKPCQHERLIFLQTLPVKRLESPLSVCLRLYCPPPFHSIWEVLSDQKHLRFKTDIGTHLTSSSSSKQPLPPLRPPSFTKTQNGSFKSRGWLLFLVGLDFWSLNLETSELALGRCAVVCVQ